MEARRGAREVGERGVHRVMHEWRPSPAAAATAMAVVENLRRNSGVVVSSLSVSRPRSPTHSVSVSTLR